MRHSSLTKPGYLQSSTLPWSYHALQLIIFATFVLSFPLPQACSILLPKLEIWVWFCWQSPVKIWALSVESKIMLVQASDMFRKKLTSCWSFLMMILKWNSSQVLQLLLWCITLLGSLILIISRHHWTCCAFLFASLRHSKYEQFFSGFFGFGCAKNYGRLSFP